jgi:ABC-2 type transport system permease protein
MKKVLVVARHEFSTTVKRLGFIIVTFGIPLFMSLIFIVSILLQKETIEAEQAGIERSRLGYVDRSGLARLPHPEGAEWVDYPNEAEARRRLVPDGVGILIILPEDYLASGRLEVLTRRRPSITTANDTFVPRTFESWLVRRVLTGVTPERVARARNPVAARDVQFLLPDASGTQETERPIDFWRRLITAAFFFVLLFLSISVSGGYLIQGMADEKENRVLEMVISSVTPGQLMAGKLIGLGAAGLLQVAIWSALGVTTVLLLAFSFALNPGLFAFCAIFYLLGYLLYGSLLLGIGSLGSNQRESMQYTWVLSLTTVAPLIFWFNILSDPQSTLAHVFTAIPLTAPMTMMVRYAVDPAGTPTWQIPATLAWLGLSTFLALRVSAKIYRVGLLLYGKRPTPREIWRWIRA